VPPERFPPRLPLLVPFHAPGPPRFLAWPHRSDPYRTSRVGRCRGIGALVIWVPSGDLLAERSFHVGFLTCRAKAAPALVSSICRQELSFCFGTLPVSFAEGGALPRIASRFLRFVNAVAMAEFLSISSLPSCFFLSWCGLSRVLARVCPFLRTRFLKASTLAARLFRSRAART